MTAYVALFRGINVGKAKRIAMADLRRLLEELGYRKVRTLLNSGNAIFAGKKEAAARHAARIRKAVAGKLAVDALVIVKSADEVASIIAENKLAALATDPSRLLIAMTNEDAVLGKLKPLAKREWGVDKVLIGKHAVYVWCAGGILESQAAEAVLKGLEGTGTTRNWATLQKIQGLLRAED